MTAKRKRKKHIQQKNLYRGRRRNWVEQFSALYEVNKTITSTLKLPQVLKLITKKASQIMQAKGCSLRLLHKNRKELILKAYYDLNKQSRLRKGNIKAGESIAGRVLKEKRYYIIKDLFQESRYQHRYIAEKENLRSLISIPLLEKGKAIGVLSVYSNISNYFHREDAKLLYMFASQASISISNARLYEKAKANYLGAIKFLANALDAKDSYTAGHSERVAKIVQRIAFRLRLSELQKDALQYAAYLHDLGKVSMDINTLRKAGKLTNAEWKTVYKHPQVGAQIVTNIEALSNLVPIILHHHARYAGGGYPDKDIKYGNIPVGSRILAVADAYEAMVSRRPYRESFSKDKACKELERCSGTQFDPTVVNTFLKIQSDN